MTEVFALLEVVSITWDSKAKEPTPKPPPHREGALKSKYPRAAGGGLKKSKCPRAKGEGLKKQVS